MISSWADYYELLIFMRICCLLASFIAISLYFSITFHIDSQWVASIPPVQLTHIERRRTFQPMHFLLLPFVCLDSTCYWCNWNHPVAHNGRIKGSKSLHFCDNRKFSAQINLPLGGVEQHATLHDRMPCAILHRCIVRISPAVSRRTATVCFYFGSYETGAL